MLPFLVGVVGLPTLEATRDGISDNGHIAELQVTEPDLIRQSKADGRTGWRRVYISCLTDR
jgi:hypothetical protein